MKKLWKIEWGKTKISIKKSNIFDTSKQGLFSIFSFQFSILTHPYSWIQNAVNDINNDIDYYQHKSYQENRSHYHREVEGV